MGENFQKFFGQIKDDIKEMLEQEKAETALSKKGEENVLQLNAEVGTHFKLIQVVLTCSSY